MQKTYNFKYLFIYYIMISIKIFLKLKIDQL
jgi:hypothetical protein